MPENCASNVECWSRAVISLVITVYGHVSRVWKSVILDNGGFLTTGEVSMITSYIMGVQ